MNTAGAAAELAGSPRLHFDTGETDFRSSFKMHLANVTGIRLGSRKRGGGGTHGEVGGGEPASRVGGSWRMGLGGGDGSAPAGAPAVPSVGGWTWRAAATVPPPASWAEGKDAELEGARAREQGGEVGSQREARGSEEGWEARRKERSGCGRG